MCDQHMFHGCTVELKNYLVGKNNNNNKRVAWQNRLTLKNISIEVEHNADKSIKYKIRQNVYFLKTEYHYLRFYLITLTRK